MISSVTFGDSFDFVLLSHSLRVGSWSLGGVDDLVGYLWRLFRFRPSFSQP